MSGGWGGGGWGGSGWGGAGVSSGLFRNLSFETIGGSPGAADAWSFFAYASYFEIAPYGTSTPPAPWETFEREWDSNQNYKFAFIGPPTDLTQANYQTVHPTPKPVENFEEKWNTNESYLYGLSAIVAPFDTGTPQNFEDFEQEWDTNESYVYNFSGTAGVYSPGAGDEDFEGGWHSNESYVYTFAGTAALYDVGANGFENFEGAWFTMTTF